MAEKIEKGEKKNDKKILIIGAGGAGLNISQYFERFRNSKEEFTAQVEVVYVDTSRANLKGDISPDRFFQTEGTDGSGGVRSENIEPIRQAVPTIVNKFKAADINVIIFSADGGSGNALGACLAAELLKRDQNVISIVVGNSIGIQPTKNTIGTLRTLDGIASKQSAPMVAAYFHNSPDNSIETVNRDIHNTVMLIATLFSGMHGSIDSRDLYNWLHYDQVTEYEPGLTFLDVITSDKGGVSDLQRNLPIASLITLGHSHNERYVLGDNDADYHKVGIMHAPEKYSKDVSVYFALTTHGIPDIIDQLEERRSTLKDNAAAKRKQRSISTGADDSGFVFE